MRSAVRTVTPRSLVRSVLLASSLLTALVVAALPGTTIASSDPTLRASIAAAGDAPILVPVSLRSLVETEGVSAGDAGALALAPSVLEHATVVSVYGHPGVCVMGELGCHGGPEGAIEAARSLATEYDALNGDRDALAAL